MLQNKTQNIWNATSLFIYLQEVTPWNQLSSCWENNQSAAFISIKSIFFTNLDKRVQQHHQNIQNHVNVFDPSRIGQELRLRAWQKRHQGPTYESQGWDVLGCLGELNAFGILELGVDLLMGLPMQNSSTCLSTKWLKGHTVLHFALLTCDLRSITTWESQLALNTQPGSEEMWRICRPKFRASKNQHQTVKFGLLHIERKAKFGTTSFSNMPMFGIHGLFKFRLNWQMILSRSLLVKEQKRKVGSGCDWKGPGYETHLHRLR